MFAFSCKAAYLAEVNILFSPASCLFGTNLLRGSYTVGPRLLLGIDVPAVMPNGLYFSFSQLINPVADDCHCLPWKFGGHM